MNKTLRLIVVLAVAGSVMAGCSQPSTTSPKEEAISIKEQDSGLKQLTLSAKAAERLGVETSVVAASGSTLTIPYAAVIYDAKGFTWTYTNAEPLVYLRAAITVDAIAGETAVISAGPAAGTAVVTTGAAELYGAEIGVGGGH